MGDKKHDSKLVSTIYLRLYPVADAVHTSEKLAVAVAANCTSKSAPYGWDNMFFFSFRSTK